MGIHRGLQGDALHSRLYLHQALAIDPAFEAAKTALQAVSPSRSTMHSPSPSPSEGRRTSLSQPSLALGLGKPTTNLAIRVEARP